MTWFVSTFYFFQPLPALDQVREDLEAQEARCQLKGLFILGSEGLNSTFCAPTREQMEAFENWVREYFKQPHLMFKNSVSHVLPFPLFKIKMRPEIVTLKAPELTPAEGKNRHLSPDQWDAAMATEDVAVIDTRNDYEFRIGSFKGAVDPKIEKFSDFPKFFNEQNYGKDKKILIFCTGGIRCEKGILELERQGYSNVYQLDGGILNYLQQKPRGNFEGECFVFDQRVALDHNLQPSRIFKLCPHCGEPGEIKIECVRCDGPGQLCPRCHGSPDIGATCSKNCAHHHRLTPGRKGRRQIKDWEQVVQK
jgi:UPF0176 protein